MSLDAQLRNIAKSFYWQRLFHASKENNINLFKNNDNLSGIQVIFLYWLTVYDLLYKELSQKEWYNLDEELIKDDMRVDAFLYWRSKEQEKELNKIKHDSKPAKKNTPEESFSIYKG